MTAHRIICTDPEGTRLYLTGEWRWSADPSLAVLIWDHPGYDPQVHGVYVYAVEAVNI